MMAAFLTMIVLIAIWWCGLLGVLSGIGLLARRVFGLPAQGAETWLQGFWNGWVFAVLILQLWHLCLKVDVWAFAFIVGLGIVGLLWNRRDVWLLMRARLLKNPVLLILMLIAGLWIADRAIGPIQNGDTGLYHMPAVKWASSYRIIPGLANLHGRLGFNNAYFLYAAMLGIGPWIEKSHYLANGLLTLALLGQLILSFRKILLGRSEISSYHLFNSLLLTPAIAQVLSPNFSGLSPDVCIFVVEIVLISKTYYYLAHLEENYIERSYELFSITALCVAGTAVKFSFLPFGGSILLLVLAKYILKPSERNSKLRTKTLLWIMIFNGTMLTTWVIRGAILSGYVAFPFDVGSLPITWRVPRPLALSEANWIRSWARGKGFWTEVLGNWGWLWPWIKYYSSTEFIKPVIVGLLSMIFYSFTLTRIVRIAPQRAHNQLIILVPAFFSLIFWFFSAPDPRFLGACLWILGAGLSTLAVDGIRSEYPRIAKLLEYSLCGTFFIFAFPFDRPLVVQPNQNDGPFYNVLKPEYVTVSLNNLEHLNIPIKTDQCWSTPLPCTPYYRPTLHLRGRDIASGFVLDKSFTFADIHQGSVPRGFSISPEIGFALTENIWYSTSGIENTVSMDMPIKLLVYVENAGHVKFSLKPIGINVYGNPRDEAPIQIILNQSSKSVVLIKPSMITEVVLALRADFNIITLDLAPSNRATNEVNISNLVKGPLNVVFQTIELTSIVVLK